MIIKPSLSCAKLIFILLFILAIPAAGQKNFDCHCDVTLNSTTRYPEADFQDYKLSHVHTKVAYPTPGGMSRIWLKGDSSYATALILSLDGQTTLGDTIRLYEPFYTTIATLNTKDQKVSVRFFNGKTFITSIVNAVQYKDMTPSEKNYSILFYGCFQPFTVNKKTKEPTLITASTLNTPGNLNKSARDYFKQVCLGNNIEHVKWKRNDANTKCFINEGEFNTPLLPNPKLVVGTGDQVYLDAGYKYKEGSKAGEVYKNHPLSAWAYLCCNPEPLLSVKSFSDHLNKTYSAFASFTTLDTVFRTLPSINIWDDHEIRDGWGSHGDEYDSLTGQMNPKLSPYFLLAKKAFIDHQWISGINRPKANAEDLSQDFEFNKVAFFTFDLRSFRDTNKEIVLGDSQFRDFIQWCNGLHQDQVAVILSSIPFFFGNTPYMERAAIKSSKGELDDDIKDSWAYNQQERDRILTELVKLRQRKVKPIIVSGDVHTGALTEVWYNPEHKANEPEAEPEVLCYELIASGLSHESLGEGQTKLIGAGRHRTENQRWNDPSFLIDKNTYRIYPSTRMSRSDLNFGALEISDNSLPKLHLFTVEKTRSGDMLFQRTMDVNFSQTSKKDLALRHRTPLQWVFSLFTNTFTPAPVEGFNEVVIKN